MSKLFKHKNLLSFLYYFIISISLILLIQIAVLNKINLSSTQLQGNLLIWHSTEGKVANMFINAVEQFKQLNPEVNLLLQSIHDKKNPSLFIEKSGAGFGSSALIIEAKNLIELLKKRLINPIDSQFIDTSIYSPLTLSQVRYLGKIYGIPLGSNTRVLCYNKAKLNATNEPIFSTPPTDLDGLIQRAIKGYTVGLVSSFEDTFWGMGTFGGKLFNELGLLEANLDGWVKWLDWLKNASLQPNVIFSRDRTILHNAFSEGKLAYYVCESKEILDFTESLKDNFRVALLPQGDGGKATPLLYTKVIVFNHSNTDNENHLGLAFGKYITNPEQQLAGIIKTQSFIPTNRNVNLNVALLPIESVLLKQAESAVAIPLNNLEQIIQVFEKGETLYQQAFVGEISTIKAAEELMLLIGNFSS
ncbi:extracellular solute-binding protein [Geminocystis sp. NIES-3709]|uniref:sugar ABC transporter substrate-binding protein n=1 Tax=Geminocystis sp. NIES-3709 TaxID=1617448 RepID=UPI000826918F|nr:extracellular solute-binding protein [Geminocystis sp. NIES-3709]